MIFLASKSAARRQMLEASGIPFTAIDAPFDEEAAKARLKADGADARQLAAGLAATKALAAPAPGLVLGADQVLETATGDLLDKPASRADAAGQLQSLAGKTHYLHSAAALARDGTVVWQDMETVALTMRPLSADFIEDYLDSEYQAIRWCVGGYRIEGPGVQLFGRIAGSHFAILGLPLLPLLAFLRESGEMPR